ncbi:Tubulin--tyrosine ligase [Rhynchospora pubera]|uniref:Tubulin--tyrosine ligase n=1 Tax=Rhynchospora pubera TaxID=906938 RepID=A0AAV8CF25_9POAL|nr:Tubulin--tyrosine ligase [Rhynchospora pubera]
MKSSIESYMETVYFKKNPQDRKLFYRKLTLWHSGTFSPIYTHDELEPIMASIGFFPYLQDGTSTDSLMKKLGSQAGARPATRENGGVNTALRQNSQKDESETTSACAEPVKWREYVFGRMKLIPGSGSNPESTIRPKLPYPRVDGLHLMSYLVFFAALECYINPYVVADLFHVRPIEVKGSDIEYNMLLKKMSNFTNDPEVEGVKTFWCRGDNLDDPTFKEMYEQLKASVDDLSQNETAKKFVRKDERRKIEEDERDDSSDFVCLIPNVEALYKYKMGGQVKRGERPPCRTGTGDFIADDRHPSQMDRSFSFISLNHLIQTDNGIGLGARVPRKKRSVRKVRRL